MIIQYGDECHDDSRAARRTNEHQGGAHHRSLLNLTSNVHFSQPKLFFGVAFVFFLSFPPPLFNLSLSAYSFGNRGGVCVRYYYPIPTYL